MNALRNLYFSPDINFQDAYETGLDRKLAVSAQFQQHFTTTSVLCPFAVDSEFLSEYPNLRGQVPEFTDYGKATSKPHDGPLRIAQLQSLSPFSQPDLVLEAGLLIGSNGSCLSPNSQHFSREKEKLTTNRNEVCPVINSISIYPKLCTY